MRLFEQRGPFARGHKRGATSVVAFLKRPFRRNCMQPAVVADAYDINKNYRLVGISGDALMSSAWRRGQKVQFQVSGNALRTHMPLSWDTRTGFAEFLFFLHGNGPGSAWAASLKRGDLCWMSLLKPCLDFCEMKGPTIFFGDETSVGSALAFSASAYAAHEQAYILEATSQDCCEQIVRYARLANTAIIQKRTGHGHAAEIARLFLETARCVDLPKWVLTGCAQSIQRVRSHLGLFGSHLPMMIVKPYWAEGKVGLE